MIAERQLKCKAAETHGLLQFAVEMLMKHESALNENLDPEKQMQFKLLKLAGEAALAFDQILAKHTRQIGDSELLELYDRYNEFVHLSARAGVSTSPKTHLMYHCIQRSFERGNPRAYTTYVDESYNGAIAKVCRSVHRANWALSVYRKLEQLESLQGKYVEDLDFREA